MRRVVLESPYAGEVDFNVEYARACVRDAVMRGEAPLASHLLYTQPDILRDDVPAERDLGITCGHVWIPFAEAVVVYTDRGISSGMLSGMNAAYRCGVPVETRQLGSPWS